LTYGLPHFTDIYDYIKIVKSKAIARNLIKVCNQITSECLAEETEIYEVVGQAGQLVFALLNTQERKGFRPLGDSVAASIKEVKHRADAAIDSPYTLRGLSTGFRDLNEKTSGIVAPELIVIAGRPSMGKTTICLNIADNATDDDKDAVVGVFSLEMASDLLGSKMLCARAKVDSHRYANAYLTRDEWGRIAQAAGELTDKRIFIEDAPKQSVIDLQAQAQRLKHEQKRLDMLVIDHLQLIRGNGKYKDNRNLELKDIMVDLAAMRKILNCPIIVLSQLSRGPEKRNPPKPMMSDLRESGSIEENADGVWLMYREDYYKPTEENQGVAEIIVGKNRNGPTGTVKLAFLKEFNKFENYYGEYDR
jgi:replicative DNA helicase